jgi:hypothetical protein
MAATPQPARNRPAATPAAATKPPAAANPAAAAAANKKRLLWAGGGAAAGVALLVSLAAWKPWRAEPPRLNEEPATIARFVNTSAFAGLPFDRQYAYMEILDDKEDAIVAAYKEGRLDDVEYRKALQAAYLGKHLSRMKKYVAKTPGPARDAYVDNLLDKKKKKGDGKAGGAKAGAGKAKPPKDGAKKSDDLSPLTAEEIKRDDSEEQQQIDAWPATVRQQWQEYRQALAERKRLRKPPAEPAVEATADAPTGT